MKAIGAPPPTSNVSQYANANLIQLERVHCARLLNALLAYVICNCE